MGRITNQEVLDRLKKAADLRRESDAIFAGLLVDARAGLLEAWALKPLEALQAQPSEAPAAPVTAPSLTKAEVAAIALDEIKKLNVAVYADGRGGSNKVLLKPE